MEELWALIQEIVEAAPINRVSKRRVLRKLDEVIGSNYIAEQYPIDSEGLDEDEFIVYSDILRALNEGKDA